MYHSIVIQPGNLDCLRDQLEDTSRVYYGHSAANLSQATGGVKGSICSDDYGRELAAIGQIATGSLLSIDLGCVPEGEILLDLDEIEEKSLDLNSIDGTRLLFPKPVPPGGKGSITYTCNSF